MTHAVVLLCSIQVLQLSVSFNPLKPQWWFGFNALSNIIRKNVRILVWFIRPGMCVGADLREREENRTSGHLCTSMKPKFSPEESAHFLHMLLLMATVSEAHCSPPSLRSHL